jgi:hypothetical protein
MENSDSRYALPVFLTKGRLMTYHNYRARFDENHLAVLDIETRSWEEMPDGGFPPWCTHTPIVCSILIADRDRHGEWSFGLETIRFGEAENPFEQIDDLLTGRSCVTFSGRAFDLPVLCLAAQKARRFALPALVAAAKEPRFHSAKHYDLADRISGFGGARGATLERLCKELQIAAKVDMHGSEVGKLFEEGRMVEVANYCDGDVASTLLLAAHVWAFEHGDQGYFASLVFQFTRWVQKYGIEHLMPFTEIDDVASLLARSLLGQIESAQANAKIDADLREKRRIDDSFTDTIHY